MRNVTLVCINCPRSCSLSVELDGEGLFVSVEGNSCPRGAVYAEEEILAPKRMLTTTVRTGSIEHPRLPVVSTVPVPKERLIDCVNWLKDIEIKLPVKRGEIIVSNILEIDVDIVASRSLG